MLRLPVTPIALSVIKDVPRGADQLPCVWLGAIIKKAAVKTALLGEDSRGVEIQCGLDMRFEKLYALKIRIRASHALTRQFQDKAFDRQIGHEQGEDHNRNKDDIGHKFKERHD